MHTPYNKDEPITSVILKCFALMCVMVAAYHYAKTMLASSGAGEMSPLMASMNLGRAFGTTVAAVSFWWMASVLSLLNRIANNGEKAAPQVVYRPTPEVETTIAKPKPIARRDDDETAKYEL